MVLEVDDFGAGLETNDDQDQFLAEARTLWPTLPEDVTRETLVEYVAGLEKNQDRIKELEQQNREFEARLAQQVASGQKTPEAAAAAAEAAQAKVEEVQRRYAAKQQVDARLQPYLADAFIQRDASGFYAPRYEPEKQIDRRFDPNVTAACAAMNAQLELQNQIFGDIGTDPYAFGNEIVQHSPVLKALQQEIAESRKQYDELKKQFEDRLAPIQQTTEQVRLQGVVEANHALLVRNNAVGQPEWTLSGEVFNEAIADGKTPEEALERARKYEKYGAVAPPPPPVQKKSPSLTQRINSRLSGSGVRPREHQQYDTVTNREPGSLAELRAAFNESVLGNG